MRNHMKTIIYVLAMVSACSSNLFADVSVRKRAVDVFMLRDGTLLLGVLAQSKMPDSTSILLRADWLRVEAPHIFAAAMQTSATIESAGVSTRDKLIQHIKTLQKAAAPDIERIGYLEERLDLFPEVADSTSTLDLVLLQMPNGLIRQRILKSQPFRQIAGIAILNNLAASESATPGNLQQEIAMLPPESVIRTLPPDSTTVHDDESFNRILFQADQMFGVTCKLIYQSGQYIAESNDQNLEAIAQQFLTSQLQSQLNGLLHAGVERKGHANKDNSVGSRIPKIAEQLANKKNADILEITTMKLQPTIGTASVTIHVYHRLPQPIGWTNVVSTTGSATGNDITVERKQRITRDSRVEQVTDLFKALGVPDDTLSTAISMGTVVEIAQKNAKEKLRQAMSLTSQKSSRLKVIDARLTQLPSADKR